VHDRKQGRATIAVRRLKGQVEGEHVVECCEIADLGGAVDQCVAGRIDGGRVCACVDESSQGPYVAALLVDACEDRRIPGRVRIGAVVEQ
jgi:hypothetical protein